jgi:prepilin signal peptidase PulO-like enzyme (type II secretory pathway)
MITNLFIFNVTTILIFGLCFGSFITMASYRISLPEDLTTKLSIKDLIFKRSFCPNCNNQLKIKHLFPVFSWLFFKGKCGFCSQKISIRYPLIEIATASLFLLIFLTLGSKVDAKLILILLMAATLMIMVVVDLEHYFIPDITQIILAILALIYHLIIKENHNISYYLLSAIGFFIFGIVIHYGFLFFTKKQGIGEDDLKFFAVAGLMLGIDQLMIFMILNGILGTIFGLLWMHLKKDETFPFAPALSAAFLSLILFKINYVELLGILLYWFEKYITKTAF